MRYTTIEKAIGQTPLAALEAWRSTHPEYQDTPLAYTGRLDPMASGKLLILIGDECKKIHTYHTLDKEYDIEVLLDIGSDTGDVLGLTTLSNQQTKPGMRTITHILKQELGTHEHEYPVFSSRPVHGKPLFTYALSNTLDTISIPTHEETIYAIKLKKPYTLSTDALQQKVTSLLQNTPTSNDPRKVLGADFRITDVKAGWDAIYTEPRTYHVLPLTVTCGSGTYMRSLAGRIGHALNTHALALSIHRTRIGRYHTLGPFSFWGKTY